MTFGLLLAGYVSYDRAFAFVAATLQASQQRPVLIQAKKRSVNLQGAIDLAVRSLGPDYWASSDSASMFRIYNAERGWWIFAENVERENEGKRLILTPFALIWQSRDKKSVKVATSDKAILLLDQPIDGAMKPGGSGEMHVVNARLERNVFLRDDKGTPTRDDDLRIFGRENQGLRYIEFDEKKERIAYDSYVTIEDRDMRVSGEIMDIVLRPKGSPVPGKPGGFDGAQTMFLQKNVHIVIKDVGRSGIMPGTAAPSPTAPKGKTPLDLRCDGMMRIDLPTPRLPVAVGPPAPPAPTFAEFGRNVEVVRGKLNEQPDRLFCDHLRLMLMPSDKQPVAPAQGSAVAVAKTAPVETPKAPRTGTEADDEEAADEGAGGALADLALRQANATGHSVVLISPSQNAKVSHCNELIYKKLLPYAADETYMRSDSTSKLFVEKLDIPAQGPDKGKVVNVMHIRCVDATIFETEKGKNESDVIARGPGILETRPGLDKPVERTAVWNDGLVFHPVHNAKGELLKQITLTSFPKLHDIPEQTTLDAREKIVAYLTPKPQGLQLDQLLATRDVHLNAPGRYVTANERLDATFEHTPPTATAVPAAPAAAPASPPPKSKFVVASDPFAEDAKAPAKDPNQEPKPADPDVFVQANRVWAKIVQRPVDAPDTKSKSDTKVAQGPAPGNAKMGLGGAKGTKSEVQELFLTGQVKFHQDPAPGESRGTDVTGEACRGDHEGNGLWRFQVFDDDPTRPRGLDPLSTPIGDLLRPLIPARVVTKEMTVEGPEIGIEQSTDKAWVWGPGQLEMETERGLLTEDGATPVAPNPGGDPKGAQTRNAAKPVQGQTVVQKDTKGEARDKAKPAAKKVPLTITWRDQMKFFGQSTDPSGRPTARAEFFDGVLAKNGDDGVLYSEAMKVYFDRPIKLARLKAMPGANVGPTGPDAKAGPVEAEPKHDVHLIECFANVTAAARKVDPDTHTLLQQERIEGSKLIYNKVTGEFVVPGKGQVWYWNRAGEGPTMGPGPGAEPARSAPGDPPPGASRPAPVTRASNPTRGTPVVSRNTNGSKPVGRTTNPNAGESEERLPLEMTQITFRKQMNGRFLIGKEGEHEPRTAHFFGDVEALHAPVKNTYVRFNADKPPTGFSYLTAQSMRAITEPPPVDAAKGTPSRTFLKAFDNAYVRRLDSGIHADVVTFDSEKNLYYAYGNDGRDVVMQQYHGVGQPASTNRARAAWLNNKTGAAEVVDPKDIALIDAKTGVRPTPVDPPKPAPPTRSKPRGRLPGRSTLERRGFSGQ